MASLSFSATLLLMLVLWSWLGGLFCFAGGRYVEMDHVKSGKASRTVPFHSGMEIGYIHEGITQQEPGLKIGFYVQEDEKDVALLYIEEDAGRNLKALKFSFKNNTWNPETQEVDESEPFKLGIYRRISLVYSEGFLNVTFWNEDEQQFERIWSRSGEATMGRGQLTIYARIPDDKAHLLTVFWFRTPPDEYESSTSCENRSSFILYLVIPFVVVVVILLVLLCRERRRTFGSQTVKDENKEEEPKIQTKENEENWYDELNPVQIPPLRHRPQDGQVLYGGMEEGRESINSIYGYQPTRVDSSRSLSALGSSPLLN